jgi:hypothetical protein
LELTDIDEVAGHGSGGSHGGAHEVSATARALPVL